MKMVAALVLDTEKCNSNELDGEPYGRLLDSYFTNIFSQLYSKIISPCYFCGILSAPFFPRTVQNMMNRKNTNTINNSTFITACPEFKWRT